MSSMCGLSFPAGGDEVFIDDPIMAMRVIEGPAARRCERLRRCHNRGRRLGRRAANGASLQRQHAGQRQDWGDSGRLARIHGGVL